MVVTTNKLPLREVARQLDRSVEQVRRYIRDGKLPAEKLGLQWFVAQRDVDRMNGGEVNDESGDVLTQLKQLRDQIERRQGRIDTLQLLDEVRGDL